MLFGCSFCILYILYGDVCICMFSWMFFFLYNIDIFGKKNLVPTFLRCLGGQARAVSSVLPAHSAMAPGDRPTSAV